MKTIIVGAGVIGLAVADELCRRGVEVVVLDKAPGFGTEASAAAAGILSPQGEAKGPGPFFDLLTAGFQLIPETVARLQAVTGVDIEYKANGMLGLAMSDDDEKEFEYQMDWQKQIGVRFERLTREQVRDMEPAVDGPVRWGVWWPQTAQMNNRKMAQAYALAVEAQGGTIRPSVGAIRFLSRGSRVTGVATEQGLVEGDWVVNCAGAWAGFDGSLGFDLPLIPVRGQIIEFQTSVPLIRRVVKTPASYLVQRSNERLIAGTTVEKAGFDKRVTEEGKKQIRKGVIEMVSRVASLPENQAWAGLRPGTPDGRPILGRTPLDGLLVAAGHYRNGVLLAPLTGRLIADLIAKGTCSIDLMPFSASRFQKQDSLSKGG
ncbi:MAG: glycine oxidase ThiO [Candidatus Omnitrophica bacterium]|nr:glycine oxidase ThiO [Candidatus Omnitrophota bacterium]